MGPQRAVSCWDPTAQLLGLTETPHGEDPVLRGTLSAVETFRPRDTCITPHGRIFLLWPIGAADIVPSRQEQSTLHPPARHFVLGFLGKWQLWTNPFTLGFSSVHISACSSKPLKRQPSSFKALCFRAGKF